MVYILAIIFVVGTVVWAVSSSRKERALTWSSEFNREKIDKNKKKK